MKILNQSQYNQGIGKFKLLSSNAGVGSIITTKLGSYALILDINKWKFVIGTSLVSIGLLYLSILNEGLLFWNLLPIVFIAFMISLLKTLSTNK